MLRAIESTADVLWDRAPWRVPATDWEAIDSRPPVSPRVCVGHDGTNLSVRECSRFSKSLLRQGCRIDSVGAVSRPCLDDAGRALHCAAWIYIESGESPAGVSVSITDSETPWSRGGGLDEVERRMRRGRGRSSRSGGSARAYDAIPAYAARVAAALQNLPSLEIGSMGMPPAVEDVWRRVADRTNLHLHSIAGTVRFDHGEPTAVSIRPLMEEIVRRRWAGGVIFGSNGQQLWVVDRHSGLVPTRDVCQWALTTAAPDASRPRPQVVVFESSMWMDFSLSSARMSFCPDTAEALVRQMGRTQARLGADGQGRLWITEPEIRCDALLTLGIVARIWSDLVS